MSDDPTFARFLAALPAPLREHAEQSAATAAQWSEGLARARAEWPELSVDLGAFAEHVARRITTPDDLRTLSWPDLYLAHACALGDPRALAAFDGRHLATLGPGLMRIGLPPDRVDEVCQDLRVALLTPVGREHPEIADYTGRGSLRGWLRVISARRARKLLVRQRRERTTADDALLVVFDPAQDPALGTLKEIHRRHFKEAVVRALETLTPRERNLLRHHLVDGLTIDEVGLRYGVARATAARWIAKARENLLGAARRVLMARFGESRKEVDSMIQFVRSRVDLSLERLLPGDEPEE